MFINKINSQPYANFQKMSSYINVFLKTEITCIPKFLSRAIGENYNNALCNGATWVFTFWCILHSLFDRIIDAFLKKLRYREFVRSRLKNGLWYLGFFGTCFLYSIATLDQNDITFFNFKKVYVESTENKRESGNFYPAPLILGHVVISTFYLHSALWEGLINGLPVNLLNYLLLFFFTVISYISKTPEIYEVSLKLTASIAVAHLALEFTRCFFMSCEQKSFVSQLIATTIYCSAFATYTAIHLIVIPLVCIVRLGLNIMCEKPNALSLILFFMLIIWLGIEIYHSVIFRFVNHWLYHQNVIVNKDKLDCSTEVLNKVNSKTTSCDNTIFECSLFLPRDDVAYHIRKIRCEIEERKAKMMAMRKPKNMFYQTLKCMVAIKQKLTEKRLKISESEDKDSDSDKSESIDNVEQEEQEDEEDEVEIICEVVEKQHSPTDDVAQTCTSNSPITSNKLEKENSEVCAYRKSLPKEEDIAGASDGKDGTPQDQIHAEDQPAGDLDHYVKNVEDIKQIKESID